MHPQPILSGLADMALRHMELPDPSPGHWPGKNTKEDHSWRLALLKGRLCMKLGLDLPEQMQLLAEADERLLVREALRLFVQEMVEV